MAATNRRLIGRDGLSPPVNRAANGRQSGPHGTDGRRGRTGRKETREHGQRGIDLGKSSSRDRR